VTIFYPDISSAQQGISLVGATAVCVKATEGTTYINPDYKRAMADANKHGVFNFAYHFLHAGNAAAQAQFCHSVVDASPLMLDVETSQLGGNPSIADAQEFADEFRKLGGVIYLVYLPHWYWGDLGSPSLDGFSKRGLLVVSSAYPPAYSDTGEGWQPYGGITPTIWQYTSTETFQGQKCDFNAFKGTVDQLKSIARTGKMPVAPKRHVVGKGNTASLDSLAKARGTNVDHLVEASKAHLNGENLAILTAYLALDAALHAQGEPHPAMPEGLVYWTTG
jgi:GH25 family lysozyme M1 (1,4-beta-N-acetylmuramidase)